MESVLNMLKKLRKTSFTEERAVDPRTEEPRKDKVKLGPHMKEYKEKMEKFRQRQQQKEQDIDKGGLKVKEATVSLARGSLIEATKSSCQAIEMVLSAGHSPEAQKPIKSSKTSFTEERAVGPHTEEPRKDKVKLEPHMKEYKEKMEKLRQRQQQKEQDIDKGGLKVKEATVSLARGSLVEAAKSSCQAIEVVLSAGHSPEVQKPIKSSIRKEETNLHSEVSRKASSTSSMYDHGGRKLRDNSREKYKNYNRNPVKDEGVPKRGLKFDASRFKEVTKTYKQQRQRQEQHLDTGVLEAEKALMFSAKGKQEQAIKCAYSAVECVLSAGHPPKIQKTIKL